MSKVRIAINGFGRIGRQVFRALHANFQDKAEIVAINALYDAETNFHRLEYDSVYGRANYDVSFNGADVTLGDWKIHCFAQREPADIKWGDVGVDIVVESTGIFRTAEQVQPHLDNGAKKVIISAPAKGDVFTVVMGVNDDKYDPDMHHIVSNASCTTNCLAPVVKILHDAFGIAQGTMVTVHSYTNDQCILDMPHKDWRRARAAATSIIPTSTGAAQAVSLVLPALKGKFTGYSLRVPTPTVSVVDFTGILEKATDTETMRGVLKAASDNALKGILEYSDKPLVSMDFKGNPHSSILDVEYSTVHEGTFCKILTWYDNEWGYSHRICDLAVLMHEKGL